MGTFSTVTAAVVDRITAHRAPGKKLAGITFEAYPADTQEGVDQLPSIRMIPGELAETWKARKPGANNQTVRLFLSVARTSGCAALDAFYEQVMNALETDPATLTVDGLLGGAIRRPINAKAQNGGFTTTSISYAVELYLVPQKLVVRGNR